MLGNRPQRGGEPMPHTVFGDADHTLRTTRGALLASIVVAAAKPLRKACEGVEPDSLKPWIGLQHMSDNMAKFFEPAQRKEIDAILQSKAAHVMWYVNTRCFSRIYRPTSL